MADPSTLCATKGCGHRRDLHRRSRTACRALGCECMVFTEPGSTNIRRGLDPHPGRK
jgi:hypothetical protein